MFLIKRVFDKLFKLKRFLYTPEIWWCVNIQYIFETISIHFQNVLKVCLNSSKFHCIESHNKLSFVSMFAKSFISETNTIKLTIVHSCSYWSLQICWQYFCPMELFWCMQVPQCSSVELYCLLNHWYDHRIIRGNFVFFFSFRKSCLVVLILKNWNYSKVYQLLVTTGYKISHTYPLKSMVFVRDQKYKYSIIKVHFV